MGIILLFFGVDYYSILLKALNKAYSYPPPTHPHPPFSFVLQNVTDGLIDDEKVLLCIKNIIFNIIQVYMNLLHIEYAI